MGTSTAGNESHAERAAKLNARKKELESLLAAKNEELYRLCVQEARLTGVLPSEAPVAERAAPPAPPPAANRKIRHSPRQQTIDSGTARRQLSHRLSAPNSGSTSSLGQVAPPAPVSASASVVISDCSSPDASHDTFSLHSSHAIQPTVERTQTRDRRRVYPSAAETLPISYSRHHTITTEQMNKLYYNNNAETGNLSRVHETHFSSSHPDITTRYTRMGMSSEPISPIVDGVPLIYQYASQLKAHHMVGPPVHRKKGESSRRNTLQRTQTYHLTSHSDYNNHTETQSIMQHSPTMSHTHMYPMSTNESQFPMPTMRKAPSEQFYPQPHEQNFQYASSYSLAPSNSSQMYQDNVYANQMQEMHDQKVKEKEWYESSLDSPSGAGLNLSRESYVPPKKPSRSAQDMNANVEYATPLTSPSTSQSGLSPDVAFESPKNCTVVESGKWIPYREVSKPFEMSDFYKYSTKFRQNNNSVQKQKAPLPCNPMRNVQQQPESVNMEHWNHSHQL